MKRQYIIGWVDTDIGKIPKVDARLNLSDKLGSVKARFSFGRMNYKVDPGLYAVGSPGPDSVVLVSCNYKLSFDALRKELQNIDAWILVLDTKGINVWCAAGKGTFGTKEVVNRVEQVGLKRVVNHRKIVVPQLGAPGVAAHEVRKQSGFLVIYGPVRASDIRVFLKKNMKATLQMRQVRFSFYDRLVLVPAEITGGRKYMFIIIAAFIILSGLSSNGYSLDMAASKGIYSTINVLMAYFAGVIIGPLLLPWLPGRSFSLKGFFAGLIVFLISIFSGFSGNSGIEIASWGLMICYGFFLLFKS